MSQTVVDVVVRTKGQEKLMKLEGSFAQVSKKVDQLSKKLPRAANGIRSMGRSAGVASVGVRALTKSLAPLLAIGTAVAALKFSFDSAVSMQDATLRATNLTAAFGQLKGIQELAAASANKFRISNSQALSDLVDLGSRLGSSGANLNDLHNIYDGFNTLLIKNRVNAQNAAAATLQLNQALGSGRLAGEEFNAINEATPQLLDKVAEVMKKTRGELKKMAGDGKISAVVLLEALKQLREDGASELEKAFSGTRGSMMAFSKGLNDIAVEIGKLIDPVIEFGLQIGTVFMKYFQIYYMSLQKLIGAFAPLGGVLDKVGIKWENFAKAADLAGKVVYVIANDVAYVVTQMATSVAGVLNGLLGGVNQFFGGIVDSSAEGMKGLVNNVATGIRTVQKIIAGIVNNSPGGAGLIVKLFGGDLGAFVTTPLAAIADGVEGAFAYANSVIDRASKLDFSSKFVNTGISGMNANTGSGKKSGGKSGGGQSGSGGADEQEKLVKAMASRLEKSQELVRLSEQELGLGNAIGAAEELRIKNLNAKTEIEVKYGKLQAQIVDKELEGLTASNLLLAQRNELKGEDLKLEKGLAELRESAIGDLGLDILRLQKKLQGGGALKEFDRAQEIERRHTAGGGGTSREEIGALLDTKMKLTEQDERQVELLQQQNALYNEMGNLITSTLTNSIEGLVKGTTDWNDVLSSTLKQLGQMLVKFGMNSLAGSDGQGLFSFLNGSLDTPGRASGGPVTGGNPYWVGEQGPELMVPRSNGNVIPHQQSMQLARSDAMADYSPGGGGGGGAATPINVSYSGPQLNFDGDQYVPKAAIPELIATAAKEGAKQGQARTMNGLRNSRAQRGRIGL